MVKATPVFPGEVTGKAYVFREKGRSLLRNALPDDEAARQVQRLHTVVETYRQQFELFKQEFKLSGDLADKLERSKIRLIKQGKFLKHAEELIHGEGQTAEQAVATLVSDHVQILSLVESEDVKKSLLELIKLLERILATLVAERPKNGVAPIDEVRVVVGKGLRLPYLMQLRDPPIVGLAFEGADAPLAEAEIAARVLRVPTVHGTSGLLDLVRDGDLVRIDGARGEVAVLESAAKPS